VYTYSIYSPIDRYTQNDIWQDISLPDWKNKLNERLNALCIGAFVESSILNAIKYQQYKDDFTTNAATIEETLLLLQKHLGFKFPNPSPVINYLMAHRNMLDVLLFACILTDEKFGKTSQISLELYSDPEIDDQYLSIYVRQASYEPDILDKIDTISNEYLEAMDIDLGYLIVTTDFRVPL
jgi:hypothetical protein